MYSTSADAQEQAALSAMVGQLQGLADRLASASLRRPLPLPTDPMMQAAAGGADAAGGTLQHGDPMVGVLHGLYRALVLDSGLRDFMVSQHACMCVRALLNPALGACTQPAVPALRPY